MTETNAARRLFSDRGILAVLSGLLVGAISLNMYLGVVPVKVAVAVLALGGFVSAVSLRSHLHKANVVPASLAALLAVALQLGHSGPNLYPLALLIGPLAVAWTAVVFAPPERTGGGWRGNLPLRGNSYVVAVALVGAVGALLHHLAVWPGLGGVIDENLYVTQGKLLASGHVSGTVDPILLPFVQLRLTAVVDGRLFTEYPPGWPALIAFATLFRGTHLLGAALTFVNTALLYRLALRVYDQTAARTAVALFAVHPWVISMGGSFFSHTANVTAALSAALLLVRSDSGDVRAGRRDAFLSGLALGAGVLVRPLTGLALGVSLVIWQWLRSKKAVRDRVLQWPWILLGGIGPALLLLAYNRATTGNALTLGYTAANGSLHNLGFGQRGSVLHHAGYPTAWVVDFGITDAVYGFIGTVSEALHSALLPASLTLFMLALTWPSPWRTGQALRLLPFLVLPVAYACFFWREVRYSMDIVPFFCVGLAGLLTQAFGGTPARRRYYTLLLVSALASASVATIAINAGRFSVLRAAVAELHSLRTRYPHLLVFVRETPNDHGGEPLLETLTPLSIPSLDSAVVVARDLGPRNKELQARIPNYTVVYAQWHGSRRPVSWEMPP